jgi:hypothetical protein
MTDAIVRNESLEALVKQWRRFDDDPPLGLRVQSRRILAEEAR